MTRSSMKLKFVNNRGQFIVSKIVQLQTKDNSQKPLFYKTSLRLIPSPTFFLKPKNQ
uniref:Uncharacterized protein n=1 Tax=Rhizophora mucronata TaxID=61149 RepID=A0A2P2R3E5_RHIMU